MQRLSDSRGYVDETEAQASPADTRGGALADDRHGTAGRLGLDLVWRAARLFAEGGQFDTGVR